MKSLMLSIPAIIILSSCEINVIQPAYDVRNQVIGSYNMKEYSNTYNDVVYYDLSISKSQYDPNQIILYNFYAAGISVNAWFDGQQVTIPQQTVSGYRIEGVGTYHGNGLTFSYSVKDLYENSVTDFCESTALVK
jgi:hypothetical protein